MTRVPGMLMIGATGRNAGKTELACRLVRRFSRKREITGIKATTIEEKGGPCPRGGPGCDACASLDGDYCITEETVANSAKDTSRLLAAGAKRVFWLRVLKDRLDEGLRALLDRIGPNEMSVCESNSLRLVAEPDLFLMVKENAGGDVKPSARSAMKYANRVVLSDGADFDISLDDVEIVNGRWALRERASALGDREKFGKAGNDSV